MTSKLPIALLFLAACHHRPVTAVVKDAAPGGEHCWWAVMRSPFPVDTVAARYAAAFTVVGFGDAAWTRSGDTAWANAGPTRLDPADSMRVARARLVAYWHGDSTHYRAYVDVQPPRAYIETSDAAGTVALCRRIATAAAVHGVAPPAPDAEANLPLWSSGAH